MTGAYRCSRCKAPLLGSETACPKCGLPMTPALAQPPGVAVRRYATIVEFQQDAASMTAAGWTPIAQSESTAGMNGSWLALAALCLVGGFLVHYLLLLGAIVFVVLAAGSRSKTLVVTYRPESNRPPTAEAIGGQVPG